MQTITLAGIVWTFDQIGFMLLIVVLPPLLPGTWIGWKLCKLDERRFRQALAVLLIASGITLVVWDVVMRQISGKSGSAGRSISAPQAAAATSSKVSSG
jgi:hypothetical protein